MTPLISVVVPCYNQAEFMDECLQSVLDQSYQNWECIIVNDGSPDNTEEVAKKWVDKDPRFKYLSKENGGLSSARNAGIEKARGEWILPLDCDDRISFDYMEKAAKHFNQEYEIIYSNAEYFGSKNGPWKLPEFSFRELAQNNCIFCSAFFKKDLWCTHGGYDENITTALEDWEFWIRIIKNENKVFKLPYTCFYYRIKQQSMINGLAIERKTGVIKYIEKKHLDFFHEQLGPLHLLAADVKNLEIKVENLEKYASSRRFLILNKILKFFGL